MGVLFRVLVCALIACVAGVAIFMANNNFSNAGGEIIFEEPRESLEKRGIKLRFLGYKADSINLVAIEEVLRGFMRENEDVTIVYESVKGQPYWSALERRNDSDLLDEVFMVDKDHVLDFSRHGKLADLSGIKGLDKFEGWVRQQFTGDDGSVFFLPICVSSYALWINYDLLKERGLSVPATWSDFEKICDQFVSEGIVPIIANRFMSLPYLVASRTLFRFPNGEKPEDAIDKFNSGEIDITETLRPGLEMIAEMIKRGWIDPEDTLGTSQTSNDLTKFAEGKRPFMVTGSWASPRIAALEPAFDWGAHPFPILPDGSVVPVEVNTCFSLNASSQHRKELLAFAEYMVRPEVLRQYSASQSSFSPLADGVQPSDERVAPILEAIAARRIIIFLDYRLDLPLRSALVHGCEGLLRGVDVDKVVELMKARLRPGT